MSFITVRKIQKEHFYISFLHHCISAEFPSSTAYILLFQSRRIGILELQDQTSVLIGNLTLIDGLSSAVYHHVLDRLDTYAFIERNYTVLVLRIHNEILQDKMKGHGFLHTGNTYCKVKDPVCTYLSDKSVNPHGYIIHQGQLSIPFSIYTIKEKGCGFIATYNLLRTLHIPFSPEHLLHMFEEHLRFKGKFGISFRRIQSVLETYGVSSHVLTGKKEILSKATTGILLYFHSQGAHYVMYTKLGTRYRFYNAVYGKREDIRTMKAFIDSQALFRFAVAINIKGDSL